MRGLRQLRTNVGRILLQARFGRDEPNRAAFGSGTEQRALRTAQHLDALDVEQRRIGIERAEGQVATLDRRVVDVDAGRGRTGRGVDAADRDVGGIRVVVHGTARERHAGRQARQVIDRAHALRVHQCLAEHADADRHILQALFATLRGHDDFVERSADGGCRGRRIGGGGARAQAHHRQRERNGYHLSQTCGCVVHGLPLSTWLKSKKAVRGARRPAPWPRALRQRQ